MAEYVVMPKLGFDMREGVLSSWLKNVGDSIERGEVIAEIETDKATLELESQVTGELLVQIHEPGAIVPVGANMAIVGERGEDVAALIEESAAAPNGAEPTPETVTPVENKSVPPTPTTVGPSSATADNSFPGGVRATPVARRVAREHSLDLLKVPGTGPDGRVRKADVESYLASPPPTLTQVEVGPDSTTVETTRLRQAIGRRMTDSKITIPHFYVTTEIDMARALDMRKEINATLPDEQKVTVNDLIIKAAALALRDFPNLNATYAGNQLIIHNHINVGTAVAVEGGLLTVVQKDTDRSTLPAIAADNKVMIARAREGKIHPDDVIGSTFTVSNLGAFDVDHFIAIINPPEVAILAVGSARQQPVVVDGELAIGNRMKVTISADHRVTDGAEAASYLQFFKELMENPLRLLL